jgi:hypothetical protein
MTMTTPTTPDDEDEGYNHVPPKIVKRMVCTPAPVDDVPLPIHRVTVDDVPMYTEAQLREYAASLVAEVARQKSVISTVNAECDHLGMRLGEVIKERDALRALRADAERFQWIDEYALCVDAVADPDNFVQVWRDTSRPPITRRTLRHAIDAAMNEKP